MHRTLPAVLAVRFWRLGLVYNNYPHLAIWQETAYTPLYAMMKCVALGYYAAVVWSMQKLYASPDLFATKAGFPAVANVQ